MRDLGPMMWAWFCSGVGCCCCSFCNCGCCLSPFFCILGQKTSETMIEPGSQKECMCLCYRNNSRLSNAKTWLQITGIAGIFWVLGSLAMMAASFYEMGEIKGCYIDDRNRCWSCLGDRRARYAWYGDREKNPEDGSKDPLRFTGGGFYTPQWSVESCLYGIGPYSKSFSKQLSYGVDASVSEPEL